MSGLRAVVEHVGLEIDAENEVRRARHCGRSFACSQGRTSYIAILYV